MEKLKFGESENINLNEFISEKELKWVPYNKFNNVEYLDKGGFGTIYKAIWKDENKVVVLKSFNNSMNENSNDFLNEWKYHQSLGSYQFIKLYGFTKDPDTSDYLVIMDYANQDLMKKCWDEDPLKRPSSEEVLNTFRKWIFIPDQTEIKDIDEELKSQIMEFINAPIEHKNPVTKFHSQACYTSRLLNFTSEKLNDILKSECLDCIVSDMNSLDVKSDKSD
ncbi:uncharacterized protein OCT59_018974 [Rhizophagus irregularis]|uniref:uncharacterized protein n=1 Tax=Rhizophagus irregularis TaxID=588596 RepID=UPI00331C51AF|nr:hypothetical protein OCT59_018974 [Rhizophagus irregularis]